MGDWSKAESTFATFKHKHAAQIPWPSAVQRPRVYVPFLHGQHYWDWHVPAAKASATPTPTPATNPHPVAADTGASGTAGGLGVGSGASGTAQAAPTQGGPGNSKSKLDLRARFKATGEDGMTQVRKALATRVPMRTGACDQRRHALLVARGGRRARVAAAPRQQPRSACHLPPTSPN